MAQIVSNGVDGGREGLRSAKHQAGQCKGRGISG